MNTPSTRPITHAPLTRSHQAKHRPAVSASTTLALLGVLLLAAAIPIAQAGPPERMTYQGYLIDANGTPLATNNPANYPVIFRVFNAASGGSPLWAEQQIVTVDQGHFSVLLGEGTPVSGEPRPLLSSMFSGANAAERYMSLSVTIGGATTEMLPRLRLLPSPYAFLATSASALVNPNGTEVLSYANNRLEVSGELFASGSLNLGGALSVPTLNVGGLATLGDLALTAQTPGGTEGGELLLRGTGVPEVPDWSIDNFGGQLRLFVPGAGVKFAVDTTGRATTFGNAIVNGSVGVGTATPTARLDVNGGVRARGGAPGGGGVSNNGYAFSGIGDNDSGMFSSAQGQVEFYGNSVERMRIDANGNVGIGTASPTARLTVNGGVAVQGGGILELGAGVAGKESSAGQLGYRLYSDALDIVGAGTNAPSRKVRIWSEGGTTVTGPVSVGVEAGLAMNHDAVNGSWINHQGNSLFYNPAAGSFIWHVDGAEKARLDGAGNLGIGIASPADHLHVASGAFRIDNNAGRYIRMYRSSQGFIIAGNLMSEAGNANSQIQWDGDGNWDHSSDRSLKKDITDAEPVLDRLVQMPVRRFRWKDRAEDAPKHFGVIAQEVQPLFPDVVGSMLREGDTQETLTVKYGAFGLIAAKAVQELKAEMDAENTALRREIGELRTEIAQLEARLAQPAQVEAMQKELDSLKQLIRQLAAAR